MLIKTGYPNLSFMVLIFFVSIRIIINEFEKYNSVSAYNVQIVICSSDSIYHPINFCKNIFDLDKLQFFS